MAQEEPLNQSTTDLLAAAVESLGGARRPGQVKMAEAVTNALESERHLAVQAGTGTGKSLAYLVPAIRHAQTHDTTVVVSTATIALQRQLVDRDLPRLADALEPLLPERPAFAIQKGRNNYVCLHKLSLDDAPSAPTVVDLGSGSGALAIAVARAVPAATVYAVERSHEAREYLRRNVEEHAPQVRIVAGDMTDPHLVAELAGSVDLVVSNPPYVPESPELQVEVYADPHEAVFSGTDGMAAIRGLVPVAQRLLRDGGALGIEHDDTTSVQVQDVVAAGGFGDIRVVKDLAGRARFVTARKLAR